MVRTDEYLTVDGLELHYSAWGDPTAPAVVCAHGLSRVGRDFDPLARALADEFHVVCPDMPGRGWSEWAKAAAYQETAMVDTCVSFCEALELETIRWVGTSMGGGLGITLAAGPLRERITHLLVNDISPDPGVDATSEALERIVTYVGDPPIVDTITALEQYYRETYESRFSPMTDAEWRRFATTSARRTDGGRVTPAHDPKIVQALTAEDDGDAPDPYDQWASIEADILVVHGSDSAVLPESSLSRMLERQPEASVLEVDSGHAPALNVPEQIAPIRKFLG